ncbi:MAG: SH3 domain-containing protein [Sphingobacteriaceae bacterium]|nr:SH3 domain-containing protein [Sphingobacteriaceae bacterium]
MKNYYKLILFFFLILRYDIYYCQNSTTSYKVTADKLNVRSAPDENAEVIKTLPTDETIELESVSNGWGKIKNNELQYVKMDYLTPVPLNIIPVPESKPERSWRSLPLIAITAFLLGPIFIILLNIYMFKAKKKRIKNLESTILQDIENIDLAKKNLAEKERLIEEQNKVHQANIDASYENLFNKISKIYGHENALKFHNNDLWIGMHWRLVHHIKGLPQEVKENVSANKTILHWNYDQYISRGATKYRKRIILEDDIVTSWQDL